MSNCDDAVDYVVIQTFDYLDHQAIEKVFTVIPFE